MKLPSHIEPRSRTGGFTFTTIEMVMAATVFTMAIIALTAMEIYGSRVYVLAATKLSATASARDTLGNIRNVIQSANGQLDVGNYTWSYGSPTNFALIPSGTQQIGNALRIQPGANTSFSLTNPYTLVSPTGGRWNEFCHHGFKRPSCQYEFADPGDLRHQL